MLRAIASPCPLPLASMPGRLWRIDERNGSAYRIFPPVSSAAAPSGTLPDSPSRSCAAGASSYSCLRCPIIITVRPSNCANFTHGLVVLYVPVAKQLHEIGAQLVNILVYRAGPDGGSTALLPGRQVRGDIPALFQHLVFQLLDRITQVHSSSRQSASIFRSHQIPP